MLQSIDPDYENEVKKRKEEGFKAKSLQMESQLVTLRGKIDDLEIKLGRHPNLHGQSKRESDSEKRRFNDSKVQELYNKAIKDVYSSQSSLDYANPPLKLDDLPTSKQTLRGAAPGFTSTSRLPSTKTIPILTRKGSQQEKLVQHRPALKTEASQIDYGESINIDIKTATSSNRHNEQRTKLQLGKRLLLKSKASRSKSITHRSGGPPKTEEETPRPRKAKACPDSDHLKKLAEELKECKTKMGKQEKIISGQQKLIRKQEKQILALKAAFESTLKAIND